MGFDFSRKLSQDKIEFPSKIVVNDHLDTLLSITVLLENGFARCTQCDVLFSGVFCFIEFL